VTRAVCRSSSWPPLRAAGHLRAGCSVLAALLLAAPFGLVTAGPASAAAPARVLAPGPTSPAGGGSVPGQPGLPQGVPAAASRAEPVLPEPAGAAWPFPSSFPRTSGTGRLAGGAALWSDFVYDDHGAAGPLGLATGRSSTTSNLAPTQGGYDYPDGAAHGNGADVFRSAVAVDGSASYWRVDWNTLADPAVPLATWVIDTDDDASTGVVQWPAGAGVRSPGLERALVVSSRGAQLLDLVKGTTSSLAVTVDPAARSFIVKVPRELLPVTGTWRVRLGAGLASSDGTAFAQPPGSASTTTEALYNLSYRSAADEPPVYTAGRDVTAEALAQAALNAPLVRAYGLDGLARSITGNFWSEDHQADVLAGDPGQVGAAPDVSAFSQVVDTAALAAGTTTAEAQPTGWSTRWYVSRLDLGQGTVANPTSAGSGDLRPNYLGRVQPYSVYVPKDYRAGSPAPLTWLLHSLGVNHNQYGALDPQLVQQACEARHSVCASTLGFGPDGWYFDEAEVDFWQVWHALAASYALDPERTVIGGYSMGGWAAYKLGLAHADLFAGALSLEGPNRCGIRVVKGVDAPADGTSPGRCGRDGDSSPLLVNARWLPYGLTQGAIDELVPATGTLQQVQDFDTLGYRYHFTFYAGEDHLVYATQDRFGAPVKAVGVRRRTVDPGHVTHAWFPDLDRRALGIGATTAYWLGDLSARDRSPGTVAKVDARALSRPDPVVTPVRTGPTPINDPTPGTVSTLDYRLGATPAAQPRIALALTDVRGLSVDSARVDFSCGTVTTRSDGPASLALLRLPAGAPVSVGGTSVTADSTGTARVPVPAGAGTITVGCLGVGGADGVSAVGADGVNARAPSQGRPATGLPVTGGAGWPIGALALTVGAGLLARWRRSSAPLG